MAALDGHEAPTAAYASVGYSMPARGRALSIHAEYRVLEGVIQQSTAAGAPPTLEQEALNAEDWYRRIVRDSFGA